MNGCKNCRKYTRCEDSKVGKRCTLYIDRNEERACWFCGTIRNITEHHLVHGTSNRRNSERLGLVIDLCADCHMGRNKHSAHNSSEWNRKYKQMAQRAYEGRGHTRKEFVDVFGKSYLD